MDHDLIPLQPGDVTELLTWRRATSPPDADETVLCWLECIDPDGQEWHAGWWDGQQWLECATGGPFPGRVLFYAQPRGPQLVAGGPTA